MYLQEILDMSSDYLFCFLIESIDFELEVYWLDIFRCLFS